MQGRCRRHQRVVTTNAQHGLPVAENVLNQQFTATAPNQKWVADITYLPTTEGWLYLAGVINLFAEVRGLGDGETVSNYLSGAGVTDGRSGTRKPTAGLLHHSDRGRRSMPVWPIRPCSPSSGSPLVSVARATAMIMR